MRYHWFRSRAFFVALGLLAILSVGGCAHYSVGFNLTDSKFKSKGGATIAVISGTKEPMNAALAKMIGDTLRKKSRYQVASQAQITNAIAPYPQNIKGPYKSAYFSIDVDWELGDRQKIANIQRSLGVDYLYVIWAPIAVSTNGDAVSQVPAIAQLFEQPNAKEVAQMNMTLFVGDEGEVYIKEGVEEVVRQLAEETKMAVVAKK